MMTKDERIRFYKSKEWQITRKRVLERDNYECQQCKRDGKLTTYDKSKRKSLDVDHILSLEPVSYTHGKMKNGKYPRVKKIESDQNAWGTVRE